MKRLRIVLICTLLLISLCACSHEEEPGDSSYTIEKYGVTYTIDPEACTIFDGTYTYQYSLSVDSGGYRIDITYPDGSSYWWQADANVGAGGWSDDYDSTRYIDGMTLCHVLEEDVPREKRSTNVPLAMLMLLIGLFHAITPHTAWLLAYGWRFKHAEPSDLALGLNRIGGILAILIAIIMLFV